MGNFYSKYLQRKYKFVENQSIDFTFLVYDEYNDVLSNTDLSDYKFYAYFTNDAEEITKYDANYDTGADTQISVSGKKVTVHLTEDETEDFEGYYELELIMVNKTSGNKYIIFRDRVYITDTVTD